MNLCADTPDCDCAGCRRDRAIVEAHKTYVKATSDRAPAPAQPQPDDLGPRLARALVAACDRSDLMTDDEAEMIEEARARGLLDGGGDA